MRGWEQHERLFKSTLKVNAKMTLVSRSSTQRVRRREQHKRLQSTSKNQRQRDASITTAHANLRGREQHKRLQSTSKDQHQRDASITDAHATRAWAGGTQTSIMNVKK